jgi:pimeloyl-ACP methyl ester carboxylesterase
MGMSATAGEPAPIALARFGSFYVGGRQIRIEGEPTRNIAFTATASLDFDPNGLFHVEQAYVQFFIPAQVRSAPVVLLHGGGMCGTMWEQTPDGREGWAQALVRQGIPVYVVDNVERGRAGWAPFPDVWEDTPIVRSAEEAWTLFRIGAAPGFPARQPFAQQRFPVADFDTFIMGAVPRWLGNNPVAVHTFCAVLDRVGPCLVLAHSQGGEVAFRAAARRPEQVLGVIAVEPSGFDESPTAAQVAGKPYLFMYGDHLDATPLWTSLVARGADFRDRLRGLGAEVDWCVLGEHGIHGNSHMLMMDDNSDVLAQRVADWVLAKAPADADADARG